MPEHEPKHVAVGQEVWVYDADDRKGSRPVPGTVAKVGRKLVTIAFGSGATKVFRLEDGIANDNYHSAWFLTAEERDRKERRARALAVLDEHGLRTGPRLEPPLETLEAIAALLSSQT